MLDHKIIHDSSKDAAANYLRAAVREIDEVFEPGYAKANPQVIAAYMQAAAIDYAGSVLARTSEDLLPDLVGQLVDAIEHVADGLADK